MLHNIDSDKLLKVKQNVEKWLRCIWTFLQAGGQKFDRFWHHWVLLDGHLGEKVQEFFRWVGNSVFAGIDLLHDLWDRFYAFLKRKHSHRIRRFANRIFKKAKVVWGSWKVRLSPPFVTLSHVGKGLYHAGKDSKGKPFGERVRYFFSAVKQGMQANRSVCKTMINYLLPLAGIAVFVFTVSFAANRTFVVKVSYRDQDLGYVTNESVANAATEIVQSRMVYQDGAEPLEIKPSYSVEMVSDEKVMTEYQLADAIIQYSGDEMTEAEGLYIDGTFYGAVEESGKIQETLDSILSEYQTEGVEDVQFVNNIEIVEGLYLSNNIETLDEMKTLITGDVQAESYYTVVEGDTPWDVAQKNNMAYSDLKALNPNIEEVSYFQPGAQILLTQSEAFLPVQVTKQEVYTQSVAYETQVTESNQYAKGTSKVEQKGEYGENQITAKVTYVNNQEVSREIISSEVVKEPVTEKVIKGTADYTNISSETGSSGFINPLPGSYLSSGYGARWGTTHKGLDLCVRGGTYGKAICASAGGTVVFAGRSGAYGNLVKIRHANGVETWYAHTSQIVVSSGQVVSQGQLIAYAGASGDVTGPHLHFEVRVNGIPQNPSNYIG
ncbi:MAG: peptidoglycan DD-metalloendopeptidase family protein [Massiliimalia sp.]|jgi:murein DD-endopeptidase MepM/ murein hydrolase activator NlpD